MTSPPSWKVALGGILTALVVAQTAFFAVDRSPQTWDPSLQIHLSYRLADRMASAGLAGLREAWSSTENIYPPLYSTVHAGLAAFGANVASFRGVQTVWLLLLAGALFRSVHTRLGTAPAVVAVVLTVSSPLVLGLSRTTYTENLLLLLIALAVIQLRFVGPPATPRAAAYFGLLVGLGALTKWSFFVALGPALAASLGASPERPRSHSRVLNLALSGCVAMVIAGPWYFAGGRELVEKLLWQATEKPAAARAVLTFDSVLFYPRALLGELFWPPIAALILIAVLATLHRIDSPTRRFWAISLVGALAILIASPHKQVRFLAPIIPLIVLFLADSIAKLEPSRRRAATALFCCLAFVVVVAQSIPRSHPIEGIRQVEASRFSPARGVPKLFLGPPNPQLWPLGELLASARSSDSRPSGRATSIYLRSALRHRYLNQWTLRAAGWPMNVRFVRRPDNASYILTVDAPSPTGGDYSVLISRETPDGHSCFVYRDLASNPSR